MRLNESCMSGSNKASSLPPSSLKKLRARVTRGDFKYSTIALVNSLSATITYDTKSTQ